MVKITNFELENVKRIKAVAYEPSENGLTIIGGNNNQGKTSVLDAIAWALGGDRFRPSNPKRTDADGDPYLKITLSNGLTVERKGKDSTLKVTDPAGHKAGQALLNEFIEQFALNLPKFMQQNNKEKAESLLKIIGVGEELYKLDDEEQRLYNQRHALGIIADQKTKYAKELPIYPGVPTELISASDLIRRQQEILSRNAENQRKRREYAMLSDRNTALCLQINELQAKLADLIVEQGKVSNDLKTAEMTAEQLHDESTAELEKSIADVENINTQIRANIEREKAVQEATRYNADYKGMTEQIEAIRKARIDLLNNANLPLPGLSVQDGELTFKGYKWDNLSSSEQLKVATAIVRKLNPQCGFVLIDKLEQMDSVTIKEFSNWLEQEGLQVIATKVGTDDECSIIIQDGSSLDKQGQMQLENYNEYKEPIFGFGGVTV